MDDSAQKQGMPPGPRPAPGADPAPETEPHHELPPEARIMLPPSRRPPRGGRSVRPMGKARPRRARQAPVPGAVPGPVVAPRTRPASHARPGPTLREAPLSRTVSAAWEQPRVLFAILATLLALPAMLLIPNGSSGRSDEAVRTGDVASGASQATTGRSLLGTMLVRATVTVAAAATSSSSSVAATHAVETLAPPTSAPSTQALDGQPASSTTAWRPPSTTAPPTTAWQPPPTTVWTPPPTTAAPPPPTTQPPGHSISGVASYYAHNPGGCAMTQVPRGTTVTVWANGRSTTCVVDDYGPFGDGRVIDLSEQAFSQLASLGQGLVAVTVTW